jgi:general stress protein 26
MFSLFDTKIVDFVKSHTKAVIATVDQTNQPSTSMIFYFIDNKNDLYFVTKSLTTKSENLKHNNKSSITIVSNEKPITVSIEGVVVEIEDQKKRDEIMQEVFKLSYSELHDYAPIIKLHKGSFIVMKFVPKLAKMTDFAQPMRKTKEDLKKY